MNKKELIKMGKHLAFLLRHDKDALDKKLINEHGWRQVSELVKDQGYTRKLLDDIVETNNKQRYEYNKEKTLIRARQGHSINVDVELNEATPPDVLFHGTQKEALGGILEKGIIKGSRLYVHLSVDEDTAMNVGKRHGTPIILTINTKQMHEDGIKFYLSNNNVWLTDHVEPKYIIEHKSC